MSLGFVSVDDLFTDFAMLSSPSFTTILGEYVWNRKSKFKISKVSVFNNSWEPPNLHPLRINFPTQRKIAPPVKFRGLPMSSHVFPQFFCRLQLAGASVNQQFEQSMAIFRKVAPARQNPKNKLWNFVDPHFFLFPKFCWSKLIVFWVAPNRGVSLQNSHQPTTNHLNPPHGFV